LDVDAILIIDAYWAAALPRRLHPSGVPHVSHSANHNDCRYAIRGDRLPVYPIHARFIWQKATYWNKSESNRAAGRPAVIIVRVVSSSPTQLCQPASQPRISFSFVSSLSHRPCQLPPAVTD